MMNHWIMLLNIRLIFLKKLGYAIDFVKNKLWTINIKDIYVGPT